jgi:5'-nucleotidase
MVGRRIAYPLATLAAVFLLAGAGPTHAQQHKHKHKRKPPKPVTVQLLAVNDFHGHLDGKESGNISRTGLPEDRVPAGGAGYLATQVRKLRHRNKHTLFVAAGDLIGGSPLLSSLFHDEPAIEVMDKLHLSVSAVGNHEFDEGQKELRRMQNGGCHPVDGCRDGTPFTGAHFRYLAANVVSRKTNKPFFPPYAIRKVGGVKIGFIGMTLKGTPTLLSPTASAGLRFRDEALTANKYVRRLRKKGVHAIVVLLHQGDLPVHKDVGDDDCPGLKGPIKDIVRRTNKEVDLFLTGHTHVAYNCVVAGRHVTSAASYGRLITRAELDINPKTDEVRAVRTHNWVVGQDVTPAADIVRLISRYIRIAAPIRDRVVGKLARSAGRKRDPSGESHMGNLVADAQRAATGAEIALVNPGIVRAGLPHGDVTYGRTFTAQPFGTTLVTMTLSGAQIRAVLEQQWCQRERGNVLYTSGITYTWSSAAARAEEHSRCDGNPTPVTNLMAAGKPILPASTFRVAVNSSIAGGADGYTMLRTGSGPEDEGGDADALAAHLMPSLTGPPLVPPARDRINRVP